MSEHVLVAAMLVLVYSVWQYKPMPVDVHLIVSIAFFLFEVFFFILLCFVHVHTLNEIVCSFHGPFFTSKSSELHLMPVSFTIKNVNLLQVI